MLQPLAARTAAARRMVLAQYVTNCLPEGDVRRTEAMRHLWKDKDWAPSPDDCPVDWGTLAAWYGEVPDRPGRRRKEPDAATAAKHGQRQA